MYKPNALSPEMSLKPPADSPQSRRYRIVDQDLEDDDPMKVGAFCGSLQKRGDNP